MTKSRRRWLARWLLRVGFVLFAGSLLMSKFFPEGSLVTSPRWMAFGVAGVMIMLASIPFYMSARGIDEH